LAGNDQVPHPIGRVLAMPRAADELHFTRSSRCSGNHRKVVESYKVPNGLSTLKRA
jgi:hypothetical protein